MSQIGVLLHLCRIFIFLTSIRNQWVDGVLLELPKSSEMVESSYKKLKFGRWMLLSSKNLEIYTID
jgi:hypothetical protein